ncbi:hypothetical protein [Acidiplasma aeolicum]|jgi:hypothetical protein|uniref:hypothetical protein n=1 Tax=Acidiplasma aeolicum TaxID=507754 RepID=UPI00371176B3
MVLYIYQVVGNIKNYHELKFNIRFYYDNLEEFNNREPCSNILASICILKNKDILNKLNIKDKKIIFLWPSSLDNNTDEFVKKLSGYGIKSCEYEIVTMPSFGIYNNKNYDYYPQEIMFFIFLDMIKRIKIDDILFLDVSTGLNEYVNSLIDAASNIAVSLWLSNIDDNRSLKLYKIISEPVYSSINQESTVFAQELNRKIFFLTPYNKNKVFKIGPLMEMDNKDKKDFELQFKYKKYYGKLMENTIMIYNAIQGNVLSYLYEAKDDLFSDEIIQCLNESVNEIINVFSDFLNNKAPGKRDKKIKNVNDIISFILSLRLYSGFVKLLTDKIKNNKCVTIDNYLTLGEYIYNNKKIGLYQNLMFLKRDIHGYKDGKNPDLKNTGNKINATGNMERNFFAHSGIDINSVEVKDGKIIFKNNKDAHGKWLLNRNKEEIK